MRVLYVGNFRAEHSTENHVARALEHNGHDVIRVQESRELWAKKPDSVFLDETDFVLWTTTYDYAPPSTFDAQRHFLVEMGERGIPVVGYHLDLWWGLDREHRLRESPFFSVDLLCTADGGHDEQWAEINPMHVWFPPAVSLAECELGTFREGYAHDVVFVGSWQGGYHAESWHRHQLVKWLKRRVAVFYPRPGEHALRGEALRDLYASAKVVVGDSCMVPSLRRYWSDRVPETTGRGGYLIHPWVEGLPEAHPWLTMWQAGEWDTLGDLIDMALADDDKRREIAEKNRAHTMKHNTYERRMEQLVDVMRERNLL